MKNRDKLFAGLAALALLSGPGLASAQTQSDQSASPPPSTAVNPPAPPANAPASAETAGVNTSGQLTPATDLPPAQAQALGAGDNTVVTNGPVPDTPASRAKYGAPLSHAGRATSPTGN